MAKQAENMSKKDTSTGTVALGQLSAHASVYARQMQQQMTTTLGVNSTSHAQWNSYQPSHMGLNPLPPSPHRVLPDAPVDLTEIRRLWNCSSDTEWQVVPVRRSDPRDYEYGNHMELHPRRGIDRAGHRVRMEDDARYIMTAIQAVPQLLHHISTVEDRVKQEENKAEGARMVFSLVERDYQKKIAKLEAELAALKK